MAEQHPLLSAIDFESLGAFLTMQAFEQLQVDPLEAVTSVLHIDMADGTHEKVLIPREPLIDVEA